MRPQRLAPATAALAASLALLPTGWVPSAASPAGVSARADASREASMASAPDGANLPPDTPSNPFPVAGSTDQDLNSTLNWAGGDPEGGPVWYDVYFGLTSPPQAKVADHQRARFFGPGRLAAETTYHWKIVAWDDHGLSTEGPVWTFTTGRMVRVPAGSFQMGCDATQQPGYSCYPSVGEVPPHRVTLDAFRIDAHEVTNAHYQQCVTSGGCPPPSASSSKTRASYYGHPDYANYPVVFVTWDNAVTYCGWAGKRLPTEAEWEKAARGAGSTTFPWGSSAPDCSRANSYNPATGANCVGDTSEVGTHLRGASPYGAEDMAGNVSEWVKDWWQQTYYSVSPELNPPGPLSGIYRAVRGGSYSSNHTGIRTALRGYENPSHSYSYLGFRCAASASSDSGTVIFTDVPLVSGQTPIRAIHLAELRDAVNQLRVRYALSPAVWTDATLAARATMVRGAHLTEVRTALAAVYAAAGRTAPTWTPSTVTPGATVITAAQITELRTAVLGIW